MSTQTTIEFKGVEINVGYTFSPGSFTDWDEAPDPDELTIDAVALGPDDLWAWFDAADWWEELEALVMREATGYRQAA